ncbi:MAG: LysE family transporter [Flavobacteriales bacterium]|nr:LysE family transporter [Flavobacteriales bacterium]
MAFLEGFAIGFGMIIFIGPVFFTLVNTTLNHGFWPGMLVTIGIFISDIVAVSLCAFGAIPLFENPTNQFYLAVVGSLILFSLGFRYLLFPNTNVNSNVDLKAHHYVTYFSKGFLVNFVNPFVFVVWISVIGMGQIKYGTGVELWVFLGAALLALLFTDSSKVVFADRLKKLVQPRLLGKFYRVVGVLLIGFGFRLVWYAWSNYAF